MADRIDENGIHYVNEPTSKPREDGDNANETNTDTQEATGTSDGTTGSDTGDGENLPITIGENGVVTVHGNTYVDGNLESSGQITGKSLEIRERDQNNSINVVMSSAGNSINFYKNCNFRGGISFGDGQIKIGFDSLYNAASLNAPVVNATQRLVVGSNLFIIDTNTRWIGAEPMTMKLATLNVQKLNPVEVEVSRKFTALDKFEVLKDAEINNVLAQKATINAQLKTNGFSAISAEITKDATISYLEVKDKVEVANDLTINGNLLKNGISLKVKKGKVSFDDGLEVNGLTRLNTLQIHGTNTGNIDFLIDRNVKTFIEGDVTIHGANLFLDESKLITSNFLLTSDKELMEVNPTSGIDFTSDTDWDLYENEMVNVIPAGPSDQEDETYEEQTFDPVAMVDDAMDKNEVNYESIQKTIKTLINPITYLREQTDPNAPKRFSINQGKYRIDHSGNILMKNLVVEKGKFSALEAYKFNANHFHVDKLVTTGVKSNVVYTDNLLKSDGITELNGVVNSTAEIFVGENSKVHVANGAEVTFQNGASLVLKNGANLDLGSTTTMKMNGDVELDINRLTFVDQTTGRKYKISFRDATEAEGSGVVMTYKRVNNEEGEKDSSGSQIKPEDDIVVVERTTNDARSLDDKLKKFGL